MNSTAYCNIYGHRTIDLHLKTVTGDDWFTTVSLVTFMKMPTGLCVWCPMYIAQRFLRLQEIISSGVLSLIVLDEVSLIYYDHITGLPTPAYLTRASGSSHATPLKP